MVDGADEGVNVESGIRVVAKVEGLGKGPEGLEFLRDGACLDGVFSG